MEGTQCKIRHAASTTEYDYYFSEWMAEQNRTHNRTEPTPISGLSTSETGQTVLRQKRTKFLLKGQPYTYAIQKGRVPTFGGNDLVFVGSGTDRETTTDGFW